MAQADADMQDTLQESAPVRKRVSQVAQRSSSQVCQEESGTQEVVEWEEAQVQVWP